MKVFAPAKVNLFLHVGARRPDGYHDLASLVVFANIGDIVYGRSADRFTLAVTGPEGTGLEAGPGNLVLKAAFALRDWAEANGHAAPPVALTLEKHLPVAAGIGGGSSDAAATLRGLAAHWALPIADERLMVIGRALGADVPVCLRAAPSLMSGDGDRLAAAPAMPEFALVLANPRVAVSTAAVFSSLQVRSGDIAPDWPAAPIALRPFAAWLDRTTNDLAPPARLVAPAIMRVEQALAATEGCLLARMSGSGATCFGIYGTQAHAAAAAERMRTTHPDWWIADTGLLSAGN